MGGWRTDPARGWAELHHLEADLPVITQADLFTGVVDDSEPDEPVRPDGFLKPEWLTADFSWTAALVVE